ncbi:hypothetical protein [Campylobacter sp. MIT 21-1682]|nr:hypothetical protein [Campylobacter sp. MIT 21-1682]MCX2750735.1 hypothetical protein [Campylobacter sp. MIT 21-1682]
MFHHASQELFLKNLKALQRSPVLMQDLQKLSQSKFEILGGGIGFL